MEDELARTELAKTFKRPPDDTSGIHRIAGGLRLNVPKHWRYDKYIQLPGDGAYGEDA